MYTVPPTYGYPRKWYTWLLSWMESLQSQIWNFIIFRSRLFQSISTQATYAQETIFSAPKNRTHRLIIQVMTMTWGSPGLRKPPYILRNIRISHEVRSHYTSLSHFMDYLIPIIWSHYILWKSSLLSHYLWIFMDDFHNYQPYLNSKPPVCMQTNLARINQTSTPPSCSTPAPGARFFPCLLVLASDVAVNVVSGTTCGGPLETRVHGEHHSNHSGFWYANS